MLTLLQLFYIVKISYLYSVGNGRWESEGITIINNMTDGNTTLVQCLSTHLTSFAVLIDVGGGLQVCSVTLLEERNYLQCIALFVPVACNNTLDTLLHMHCSQKI